MDFEQTEPVKPILAEGEETNLMELTEDQTLDNAVNQALPEIDQAEEDRLLQEGSGGTGSKTGDRKGHLSGAELKKLSKQKKIADGTWIPPAEWRRTHGYTKKKKKNKSTREPGPGVQVNQRELESTGKRLHSDSSESPGRTPVIKRGRLHDAKAIATTSTTTTTTSTSNSGATVTGTGAATTATGLTASQALTSVKMVLVPEKFPERRLTEGEVLELRGTLADVICEAEDPQKLRICKSFHERGACVLICENEDTRAWVMQTAPKLRVGGGEEGKVIAGDYKTLMRTTRILLRPPDPLAGRDVKQILQKIKVQNAGLCPDEWKVVADNKGKDFRTIALLIDDISAQTLKVRDWKVYLGADQVRLKVLLPSQKEKEKPSGNEGTGPSV